MNYRGSMFRLPRIVSLILLGFALAWPACGGVTVGSLTVEHELTPGQVAEGTILMTNNGDEAQSVSLYQTDYRFACDGSNQFAEPGSHERSNAAWITFTPHQFDVPPHQKAVVHYQILVPADSTLAGTFWSMIMIEEVPPPDTAVYLARNQALVRQVMRYGVQCVTHIGKTGSPAVDFIGTRLVPGDGGPVELQVDVENSGQRWIVPTAWMELYDLAGERVGRFEGEKKRIFPGTSVRFHLPLAEIASGHYKALVVLDNGEQSVFGAKYDLEF